MAWREYVDPSNGQWYITDDDGNFLPGRLADNGVGTQPPATQPAQTNPYTMPVVGGTAQIPPWLAGMDAAYQERYFNDYILPQMRWNQGMDVANLSGYMPGANFAAMQGTTPGGAAGTYQTVMGPRTIQQMRDELVSVGGPEWKNKSDQEVIAGYAGTAQKDGQKGPVTPMGAGDATGGGGSNLASSNKAMVDWYHEFTARNNGRAPSKEEWAGQLSFLTGMDRDKAVQAYDYWRDWQARTGKSNPNDEEWARGLEQVQPGVGRERTLAGNAQDFFQQQQFPWQQTMDKANLLASKSGPQDWIKYQQTLQGLGQPDQNNSWNQQYADFWGSMQGTGTGGPNETAPAQRPGGGVQPQEGAAQVPGQQTQGSTWEGAGTPRTMQPQQGQWATMQQAPQTQGVDATAKQLGFESRPNQISAQKYYNWSPSMKQMQGGYAENKGWDQGDFWNQMQKSLPKGQASSRTVWR